MSVKRRQGKGGVEVINVVVMQSLTWFLSMLKEGTVEDYQVP